MTQKGVQGNKIFYSMTIQSSKSVHLFMQDAENFNKISKKQELWLSIQKNYQNYNLYIGEN